ncbi:hypothetical protein ACFV1W_26315 [Kitasatospora sp. NPDC059648]|uniref:hypothetical protein n=1 Tax=Kitasatospora sp. NPDC059648 TaxID=3346894 RepID=UPI0036B36B67
MAIDSVVPPDTPDTPTEQTGRLEAHPLRLTVRPPSGGAPVEAVLASFLADPVAPDTSCAAALAPRPLTVRPAPESA